MRVCLLLMIFICQFFGVRAKSIQPVEETAGYEIPLTLSPLKNCWVYMCSYYGKYTSMADSAWLDDNSKAVFKGAHKLPGGVYFILSPQKVRVFEFLLDEHQQFSIKADTAHLDKLVIKGSSDNITFLQYNSYLAANKPRVKALLDKWKTAAAD